MKASTAIKGACGEFYVASYLSALGLVVALPRGGVPSSDLLVTTTEGGTTLSLQVKTATAPYNKPKNSKHYYAWSCAEKSLALSSPTHWYAFVDLNGWGEQESCPVVYFIPSEKVATVLQEEKANYPGPRLFFCMDEDEICKYKNKAGSDKLLKSITANS